MVVQWLKLRCHVVKAVSDWCTIIFLKLLVDFCFPVTLTNLTLVDFLRAKHFSFETQWFFLLNLGQIVGHTVLCYHKYLSKVQWSSVKHKDYWAQLVYNSIELEQWAGIHTCRFTQLMLGGSIQRILKQLFGWCYEVEIHVRNDYVGLILHDF